MMTDRLRGAVWHLAFSLILLVGAFYFIFFVWYPWPLWRASGVLGIYGLLVLVQLILGPALTFFLYKKEKSKFVLDVLVVLLIQLAAYVHGLAVVAQGRPAWLVFAVDDFEIVRPADLNLKGAEGVRSEFFPSIGYGPSIVAAVYSENKEIQFKQKQDELISGKKLVFEPGAYRAFATQSHRVQAKARRLEELEKFNSKRMVDDVRSEWPVATSWLPLKGAHRDMAVLLDKDAAVVAVADLRPWD